MKFYRVPFILRSFYPEYRWRYETQEKVVYLTFDDGPTPRITDWVLEQLERYDARATFFMIGKNVQRYPEIAHRVIDAGHEIGNHTQNHPNGWKSEYRSYLKDVLQGHKTIAEYTGINTHLFRPPYAKITHTQARQLSRYCDIVMMDVISGDFDVHRSKENILHHAIKNTREGSIVVFHDSVKAWDRLSYALPLFLDHFSDMGYTFEALTVNDTYQEHNLTPSFV